jgi:YVTN family beta-propeller protein
MCLVFCCHFGSSQTPGSVGAGRVLLPNGWYVSPAGKQISLGGFPLRVVAVPHTQYAVTTSNGYGDHFLALLDVSTGTIKSRIPIHEGWMGLAVSPDGSTVYAAAGDEDRVLAYRFQKGELIPLAAIPFPKGSFPAGVALSGDGTVLYAAGNLSNSAIAVDVETHKVLFNVPVGHKPYGCAIHPLSDRLYVTNWGGDTVSILNSHTGSLITTVQVDAKPNDILITPNGKTVFVANGDRNSVFAIDAATDQVLEQIDVSFPPTNLPGTMPNALALSSTGRTLYVANADNNSVAVVDVSNPSRSVILGFIPTGWFPTGVAVVPTHPRDVLVVANAKGAQSFGIGSLLKPGDSYNTSGNFTGRLLQGTVSFIPEPSRSLLRRYSLQVRDNWPGIDQLKAPSAPFPLGHDSPIKHLFYFIKENRTYDQVLGDIRQGNGDARYTLFGEQVTPNQHALVRQFTLIDNLYHNAEASATGHFWTDSAYSTEYVEKLWPSTYSGRGGRGSRLDYHDDEDDNPTSGFLWDECARHGISYRSYGEFSRVLGAQAGHARAATKQLVAHVNVDYLGSDAIATFSDLQRYSVWHKEFEQFIQAGSMPAFQVISLPGDHTLGTRPGALTPRAMVAENDYVLGKMIDDSAVFVIEDDSQSGPDHIDCHRTTAYVLSPYVRRGFVDHTMYSSVSLLLTMEKILGVPPMTQFDGVATPMWRLFQARPDMTPYTALQPQISLDERNTLQSYGAIESMHMPLDAVDEADEGQLNRIIWKSIRGSNSVLPPPRLSGASLQWLMAGRK